MKIRKKTRKSRKGKLGEIKEGKLEEGKLGEGLLFRKTQIASISYILLSLVKYDVLCAVYSVYFDPKNADAMMIYTNRWFYQLHQEHCTNTMYLLTCKMFQK